LKVYGKATDDSIDIDMQICDEDWLKRAMPDWFTTGGNIREQHSNIAAGVATDYESKADGHYITALVVDPVSVKKVESGVLKGFSIGIRSPRVVKDATAVNGRIVDGQIVEVSLVDRPANPNAKLMLAKAAESGELMAVDQLVIPTPADMAKSLAKKSADEVAPEVEEESVPEVEPLSPAEPELAPEVEEEVELDADLPEAELLNAAKSMVATLNKFDKATYEAALNALSNLIVSEANEMAAGDDERKSIKNLLRAVKALFKWYQGEVDEGEAPALDGSDDADGDADLNDAMDALSDALNLSADADSIPAVEADEPLAEEPAAELDLTADDDAVASIVEKAVASAKKAVIEEIDALKSAVKAAEQKAATLESDLAVANSKAAQGGPKRTVITKGKPVDVDQLLSKAANYLQIAESTTDKVLAQGYQDLAAKLSKKARKAQKG
jgi:hypothetical protein